MKYVIDTNIVSEVAKPWPNEHVIDWFWDYGNDAYLSVITIEELYYGALILPDGKRRDGLLEFVEAFVKDCRGKALFYDGFAAYLCAELRAKARRMGRSSSIEDYMIAAICKANGATLVTHNAKDFDYLGIEVIDPFDYIHPTKNR